MNGLCGTAFFIFSGGTVLALEGSEIDTATRIAFLHVSYVNCEYLGWASPPEHHRRKQDVLNA